jgi:hypothetical protein
MHNEGRLFSQVAAEAGVPAEKAIIACYLLSLSKEGKTLDEAATLLRKERCDARDYARDWSIPFVDYDTKRQPLSLSWRKEKRGRWILAVDGLEVAEAISDGEGGYDARELVTSNPRRARLAAEGSKAEIAMRRLSLDLERRSVEVFGVDDVLIFIEDAEGAEIVAPKMADDPARLRKALAAA